MVIRLSHLCMTRYGAICSPCWLIRRIFNSSITFSSIPLGFVLSLSFTCIICYKYNICLVSESAVALSISPSTHQYKLSVLLTRLLEALYEDLPVYSIKFEVYHHFSGLSFLAKVSFWRPLKTFISCDLFIIIIIIIIFINFFRWVFSECTEAITTSLIPRDHFPP